ncbi:MAG: hypothetical protein HQ402_02235 [Parcubacteria group bacterium]|nr:hypothetical protein [Parcubacteria group bacterium]
MNKVKSIKKFNTKSNISQISKKHFQKDGKWISKPSRTEILVCKCGAKYIKTRDKQTTCVGCINKGV